MDLRERLIETKRAGTPEDVAALYSWANLHGAKYRDFSASKREARARVRHGAALALREKEASALADAEAVANEAEQAARAALFAVTAELAGSPMGQAEALRRVQAAVERAVTERGNATLLAHALARLEATVQREEREIAEARVGEARQARNYLESDARRRQLAGRQPGERAAPYASVDMNNRSIFGGDAPAAIGQFLLSAGEDHPEMPPVQSAANENFYREMGSLPVGSGDAERVGPAWLYASHPSPTSHATFTPPRVDTLQDLRGRVAARWSALNAVFGGREPELKIARPAPFHEVQVPLLLVFSFTGGVGKTSLAATLGKALSASGEKILIADTTSHGILPFYFGVHELRPGVVRTCSHPDGSANPSLSLVSYDMTEADDERRQATWTDEIFHNAAGHSRVVLDLSLAASWLIRRMAAFRPTVLVPVAPDMNSVVSLRAMESFFQGILDGEGLPLLPFYLLNQFDGSLPLHLDVREVLRRQLGERLLGLSIRRSPAVGEALAEGMMVLDYAPDSAVAKDYLDVANWVRDFSPSSAARIRAVNWRDR